MIFRTPAASSSAQGSKIFGLNGYVGEPVLRSGSKRNRYARYSPVAQAPTAEVLSVPSGVSCSDKRLNDAEVNNETDSEPGELYTVQNGEEVFPAEPEQNSSPVNNDGRLYSEERVLFEQTDTAPDKAGVQVKAPRYYHKNFLTTKGIFWFIALISVPVVNVAALLICSFKHGINESYRAVSRAVLIWLLIFTTAVSAVAATLFFMRVPIDITSCYKSIRAYLDGILL